MIIKEVKKYKQGNSFNYRIHLSKRDKLTGNVCILTTKEHKDLTNELSKKKKEIGTQSGIIDNLREQSDNNQIIKESNEKLEQNIDDLKQKLEEKDNTVTDLKTKLQDKDNKIATLENTNKTIQETNDKLKQSKNEINTLKGKNEDLTRQNKDYIYSIDSKDKEITELIHENDNQKQKIKDLKTTIAEQKNELEKQQDHEKTIEDLKEQLNNLKLEQDEDYEMLKNENSSYIRKNAELLHDVKKLNAQINVMEKNEKTLKESNNKFHESIEKVATQQHQVIAKLTKEYQDQLKQTYEQFNKDTTKHVTVNQLQNQALKQIQELGFIDIIRNKHKKIAKDQIKELNSDKKVYELAPKEK